MQFVSKFEPITESEWKLHSNRQLIGALEKYAPGVRNEIFQDAARNVLINRNGILHRAVQFRASGPIVKAQLNIFSAKCAMAAFRELIGRPLNLDGVLFTQWYTNGGMDADLYEATTSIMPMFSQLKQGKKESKGQFSLRYNADNKSIIAAMMTFHNAFHVMILASDDARFADAIKGASSVIRGPKFPTAQHVSADFLQAACNSD